MKRCRRGHQPEDISQISTTTDHARTRESPISVRGEASKHAKIFLATLNTHGNTIITSQPWTLDTAGDTATLAHSGCSACLNTHCDDKVCQPAISRLGSVPVARPGHGKPADDGQPCRLWRLLLASAERRDPETRRATGPSCNLNPHQVARSRACGSKGKGAQDQHHPP